MSTGVHPSTFLYARATSSNGTSVLESFAEEIQCYSLPYGLLGFISHVLTYYTIVCLWFGRKPLWPFSRVSFSRFDLALGGFGLLISTLLSIVTIVRCKDTWQLLVIAVWKMSMSLLNGLTAVHVAILFTLRKMKLRKAAKKRRREGSDESNETAVSGVKLEEAAEAESGKGRHKKEKSTETTTGSHKKEKSTDSKTGKHTKERSTKSKAADEEAPVVPKDKDEPAISVKVDPLKVVAWWIVLYIPGMFAGITGLMALVVEAQGHGGIRGLTAGFYAIVGAGTLFTILGIVYRLRKDQGELGRPEKAKRIILGAIVWVVGSFSILAVFYSDWALGMMTNNITGLPSSDAAAVYWTYWVAKRLPMFSL
ncbi:hypothetical protein FA15DRAFT_664107 [Coprinopsis marcescibilis]|uniref:Uncharacterized protein n=1 Tax=Coprinopsis marcescibilis TaxID=230819 RepID=A0A5C3L949_COPMA|nr:hypothetical protein FA15DRAFT_664107 [Coprinopsis marcescibilis]